MEILVIIETIVILFLLTFFILLPVYKKGWIEYIGHEKEINPIIRRLASSYIEHYNDKISKKWLKKIVRLTEDELPSIQWKEDNSLNGMDSFYCLDQQSEDVRDLLHPSRNLVHDKMNWWRARFTNDYMFVSEELPVIQPCYEIEKNDTTIKINTESKLDTWIYLVAKKKQPTVYALDFDYIPHIEMQETLQICFASNSLASRFRFNLENNKTLKFDVVDHGNFAWWQNTDEWKKRFQEKCTLPLHEQTHVRLLVINDVFAIYYNDEFKMAVRVNDYQPTENFWYLIFWNGVTKESPLKIELSDFKILHPSKCRPK